MAAEKTTMKVNIVAADHPVWHGEATSVTIPASEGGMGILPDHEPVLTVIKQGTLTVVEPDGDRHMFEVTDGFISFDSNKLTVAAGRGMRYALYVQGFDQLKEKYSDNIANTIKGNCQIWAYLQSDDPETLREMSDKLGSYTTSSY